MYILLFKNMNRYKEWKRVAKHRKTNKKIWKNLDFFKNKLKASYFSTPKSNFKTGFFNNNRHLFLSQLQWKSPNVITLGQR